MTASIHIAREVDLSALNTLGLPAIAEHYAEPASISELQAVLAEARSQQWPVVVLGGGSNVIPAPYIEGVVIRYSGADTRLEVEGDSALLHAAAGADWPTLVEATAEAGWWGIENLALIPGSAGAAPVQNIGAYGVEIGELIERVVYVDQADNSVNVLSASECGFGYRDSVFKNALSERAIIVEIVLRVSRHASARLNYADLAQRVAVPATPAAVAAAVSDIRRDKLPDPRQLANAGSFFKNPTVSEAKASALAADHPDMPRYPAADGVKLAAGWLIDRCGLKGVKRGHFGIHERQALVIVHFGDGSAQELSDFANSIAAQVADRFGIQLEQEPRRLGFSD
ncbi:UDP-N-acetylmuramate dehydrogenase [Carnimonas bestiolae]|uniref:UDP-N-acetylmuramate dehydrogenase n=1 Tax=Carnimonas bestiolae TaxID=3402172 RepID=UPI003EDBF035